MKSVLSHFDLAATLRSIQPFGAGHINDSFRVDTTTGAAYFLQRINHLVFPDVAGMMNNINLVTGHVRQQIERAAGAAGQQQTLTIVPSKNGELFHLDDAGNYWRMYNFMTGLQSFEHLETPEQAFAGAKAYGYFLRFLDDAPAHKVVDVIPDFHNIISRLAALEVSWKQDIAGRGRRCKELYQSIANMASQMTQLQKLWDAGKLPTRITHNDTKFNNVLFNAAGNGVCVVDLDTVMRGIVHFDFGDGVRTGAATAAEDESDLHLVSFDQAKYDAFREGYLEVTKDYLSPLEVELLPLAGPLLAYLMGVRFLTDFLDGDRYYKIGYPDHNLVRARNQVRLAEEMGRWLDR